MKYTRIKLLVLGSIIMILFAACSKEGLYQGDHFFVENKGASMPVYVKGNIESNVFVIFLHGGPGSNASQAAFVPAFKELEEDYAMAYYDQRGSGLSHGNPNKSTFTVEQFVEDLDMVVDAINLRYNSPKIFFYGISWGGALGCAYMTTDNLQDKITGFINMDSGHNLVEGLPLSVIWVRDYAQKQIDLGIDVAYWTEARDWCNTVPDMTIPENYFKYVEYLPNTNASRHNPDQAVETTQIDGEVVMNSFMSLATFFNGVYLRTNFNILELNLSPQLHKIKKPTMVLWGRHDGINTIDMGFDAYNSIGDSTTTNKEMIILENSGHEGYVEEQDLFQHHFRRFINRYK